MRTPFDETFNLLRDAINALSEAEDAHGLPLPMTRDLQNKIDAALVEAIRLQGHQMQLLEDDGPDPDRLRDEWLDDQWRSQ